MRGETGRGMRGSRGGVTHLTQNRAKIKCYFCNELAKFAVGSHLPLAEPDVLLWQHLPGCEASVCECMCVCVCATGVQHTFGSFFFAFLSLSQRAQILVVRSFLLATILRELFRTSS